MERLELAITLNGQPHPLPPDTRLSTLVEELGLGGRVAVELNAEVVPRAHHAETTLKPGDRVEIVTFVGGG